ncbi:hypothetical protein E3P92_03376 [Wallemia ichthyophaga]|uniref:Uncharacterized protein n=1 Tax=Wallemia ichthyophaga TaxID=245174 RepID=A0A4T0K578_WALIC|nr:hypothetical protein E3P91_03415 [Wallemia ichthyophaga]TIA79340.1 hypothetical protein E3P98_03367 [Wallemia ichthyophaga]TIA89172.1 hypothetical protein E3P97_03203 [Wallemia ichthyophaga]TIB05306.1 hypothetical protein E3P96_01208 [Wallemia ichthyophaga]TIB09042.1 hypothetical protein E3P93_03323 [Wallemia ichthyophaga]
MSFYRSCSDSEDENEGIQICWQASQSNLLHQLAGTQMTRLPPPPPLPLPAPSPQIAHQPATTSHLNRKSLSFTRNNKSSQFRRTRTRRTRSQLAQQSSASFEPTGTDKEDSDSETTGKSVKKARIDKQNTELDILIEKVSARLQRERSSTSSLQDHGGSATASCSYVSESLGQVRQPEEQVQQPPQQQPPQQPQQLQQPQLAPAQKTIIKQSQNQNIPENKSNVNKTTTKKPAMRKPPPPQGPNQRFKPPQRVANTNTSFPPQAQQRPDGAAANTNYVKTKPTVLDVDVDLHMSSGSKSQSQSQRQPVQPSQPLQPSQPPSVTSDGADYSCDDFDMDVLEQVCAQFD